jgi:hypothetical protein
MYFSRYYHQECCVFVVLEALSLKIEGFCISADTLTRNAKSIYFLRHSYYKYSVYVFIRTPLLCVQCLCTE